MANLTQPEQNLPDLTLKDLNDPTLHRLNTVLKFLASQIALTQGITGSFTFEKAFLRTTDVPTADTALLSLGAAKKLFGGSITVNGLPVPDTTDIVRGSADPTKLMRFDVSGFTSGSEWIITPPDEDIDLAANEDLEDHSGGLTCTTSYQDVGLQVTLDKDGTWLIGATIHGQVNSAGVLLSTKLVVNSVDQSGIIVLSISTGTGTDSIVASASRCWTYVNVGSNVAKLQAKVNSTAGSGGGSVTTVDSNIFAVYLHP